MGNKLTKSDLPPKLSKKELLWRQWERDLRELRVSRAKAGTFRNKVLEAYSLLDSLRFDYLSDTAFRDKITRAKRGLEGAIDDFLLSDIYWEQKIKEFTSRTPEEYDKYLKSPLVQSGTNPEK